MLGICYKLIIGCILVIFISIALMLSVAAGSILSEDVQARRAMVEQVEAKRVYAKKHCDYVSNVEDPKNTTNIMRRLYRCPAYQMLVI